MRTGLTRVIAALALISSVGAGLASTPAGAATSTPPWEPDTGNAVATLTFYDASGNVVRSGNSADSPFETYAVASSVIRAGDKSAALYYANPSSTSSTPFWGRQLAGNFSAYPVSSGPANIQTLSQTHPVATAASGDLSLDDFESLVVPDTTAGYQNMIQIRMRTADASNQTGVLYADADLMIDPVAHTWTQVYPTAAVAPDAPAGVTAVAGDAAATVSWTAPANTGGAAITGYDVQYSANGGPFVSASSTFHTSTATSHGIGGLTDGTSYVFRVAAINAVGTGAYSTPSAAVIPVADASTLTIAAPTTVRYGAVAAFSARLTDAVTHAGIAGQNLALYRRATSTSAWAYSRTVTTSSTGTAAVSLALAANGQYYFRYAGSATHKSVNSAVKVVTVSQILSVYRSATSVRHGAYVSIYGTVAPAGTGQLVYLQRYYSGAWHSLTRATIKSQKLPNGHVATGYVLPYKLTVAGTYTFRTYKPATSTLVAGYSAAAAVRAT